jgi:hypothetical protein
MLSANLIHRGVPMWSSVTDRTFYYAAPTARRRALASTPIPMNWSDRSERPKGNRFRNAPNAPRGKSLRAFLLVEIGMDTVLPPSIVDVIAVVVRWPDVMMLTKICRARRTSQPAMASSKRDMLRLRSNNSTYSPLRNCSKSEVA